MSLFSWLSNLWQSPTNGIEAGWLPTLADQKGPGEFDYGDAYVEIQLLSFSVRYDHERFRDRRPLVQSAILVPNNRKKVPIATTIGPDSLTSLPGDTHSFKFVVTSPKNLTGKIPFNAGDIELALGLLSVRGSSDILAAAKLVTNIADLVKVPEISQVATLASTLANGVDLLLGGDDAEGLIGLTLSISPSDLARKRYYVAIEPQEGESLSLDDLVVDESGHLARRVGETGQLEALIDWNYLLLEITAKTGIGAEWREIAAINDPFEHALERVFMSTGSKQSGEVRAAIQTALYQVRTSHDLCLNDRDAVAKAMRTEWDQAFLAARTDTTYTPSPETADHASLNLIAAKEFDRSRALLRAK